MTDSGNGEPLPFELTETDRQNLAQGDAHFKPLTWDDLREIIARNDLSILKRKPSDLIRYIAWTNSTKAAYGSITNFILQERLHWVPLPSSSDETGPLFVTESDAPFISSNDYQILPNDWPYGMEPGISHLVVWLKTRLAVEGEEGQLTAESRALVDGFVKKVFEERLAQHGLSGDRILWFKNWVGLQSVRGVEHVHVLVRQVPRAILGEWTGT
ncbi:MAG: hypothetical protein HETSPECPRED_006867 [Heterodermia speciosa]|uniref:N-acetylglucosamine-induced protein 1 n=1 Tax=Heterodermia speciosa TaxID=116794 RepID=A0A8H3IR74_9LECA|nr:MAG: hypothetical protein HETSPECPRED_006867 [Heterodermia speciosa]